MNESQERFYKLAEVQAMLGVSRTTLWRWTAEHGLRVVRVGEVVRIRATDLEAFLRRHEANGAPVDSAQGQTAVINGRDRNDEGAALSEDASVQRC